MLGVDAEHVRAAHHGRRAAVERGRVRAVHLDAPVLEDLLRDALPVVRPRASPPQLLDAPLLDDLDERPS